ncbi:MAG: bifunctional oligoribonuclease/PAP phosphatase NrnA [Bacteroidetes bacterium]|nr:MAG: bifunctional oligoribonuclease/PAP phosphatase NrnA [Bacteroidota bacterium]
MGPVTELRELLGRPRRIAITTHQKPDADALGSSLGLYHYLTAKGHKVSVVTPTDYPDFLRWIPGSDIVIVGPADPERANWIFDGADIIFCLDFNALGRINEFGKSVKDSEAKKVMIDHHLEPEPFEDIAYVDMTASSTAELIYRLIVELGDEAMLTLPIAEALYAGIMTDTGSFRFTNTSPKVHRVVAHLMEIGVNVNAVYEHIFNTATLDRLRFTGYCLSNCLFVRDDLKTAYVKIEKEVFRQFNVRTGDTEGLVNYALSIKGVQLGVLITAQDDIVKLSFRSRNEVSSAELAKHFGGGGHFYAAGGKSQGPIEEVEKKLLEQIALYLASSDTVASSEPS